MALRIVIRVLYVGSLLGLVALWANPVPLDARAAIQLRGGVWCCDLAPDGQGNMVCPIIGNPVECPDPCTGGPAHVYSHVGTTRRVRAAIACVQPPNPPFCAQPQHETYGLEVCPNGGDGPAQ